MKPTKTITPAIRAKAGCPSCGSKLAYPLEQKPVDYDLWHLRMRCPECFARWHADLSTQEASAVGCRFIRGLTELERQLKQLQLKHMTEECEKFATALRTGLIQPVDF